MRHMFNLLRTSAPGKQPVKCHGCYHAWQWW